MIHGILHLLGLNDHTKPETEYMRKKENEYLVLLESDGYEI
jgi:ssRNA-specific RNase YbeY (16S rRNA maturation enzyme)